MTPTPILEYSTPQKSTSLCRAVWYWAGAVALLAVAIAGEVLVMEMQDRAYALLCILWWPSLALAMFGMARQINEGIRRRFDLSFAVSFVLLAMYVAGVFIFRERAKGIP